MLLVGWKTGLSRGSWWGGVSLLAYAAFFSFAYLNLSAGTGALILFASVQVTMIGSGLMRGERLSALQSLGVVLAVMGLIGLVLPGVSRPDPLAALMMIISGVGWGTYSLMGRRSENPLGDTAANFVKASLMALPLFALWLGLPGPVSGMTQLSGTGILLAVLSGTVTSGLGYAIWYRALRGLTAVRAGVVQLAVPPLAALGGVILLDESVTARLILASLIILGGIALTLRQSRNVVQEVHYENSK